MLKLPPLLEFPPFCFAKIACAMCKCYMACYLIEQCYKQTLATPYSLDMPS